MNLITNLSATNECHKIPADKENILLGSSPSSASSFSPSGKASTLMASAFASMSEMANTVFIPSDLADSKAEFVLFDFFLFLKFYLKICGVDNSLSF